MSGGGLVVGTPVAVPPLVLASSSIRRLEMLRGLGLEVEVLAVGLDESPLPGEAPAGLVRRLAMAKASAARESRPGAWIVGADTVTVLDGEILGKPVDAAGKAGMLRAFSGRWHSVLTGYAILAPGLASAARVVETRVKFRVLPGWEIAAYVAGGEGLDKAGGYAIQGGAARMVERIDGSYTNVVGLPLSEVWADLLATAASTASRTALDILSPLAPNPR